MTLIGKITMTALIVPVVLLFLWSWIRVLAYLSAVAKALAHIESRKWFRYLLSLSFMNFPAAAKLISTEAGQAAHNRVMQRFRRAIGPTLWSVGSVFFAIGLMMALQATGLIEFE